SVIVPCAVHLWYQKAEAYMLDNVIEFGIVLQIPPSAGHLPLALSSPSSPAMFRGVKYSIATKDEGHVTIYIWSKQTNPSSPFIPWMPQCQLQDTLQTVSLSHKLSGNVSLH
ncbi:Elongation factor G, partial [Frankliniella fusca]